MDITPRAQLLQNNAWLFHLAPSGVRIINEATCAFSQRCYPTWGATVRCLSCASWKDYPSRTGGNLTTIRTPTGNKEVKTGMMVALVRPTSTRFRANMHCLPSPSLHSLPNFTARSYLLMSYSEGQTAVHFYSMIFCCFKKSPAPLALLPF